jgi:hypothetical protein
VDVAFLNDTQIGTLFVALAIMGVAAFQLFGRTRRRPPRRRLPYIVHDTYHGVSDAARQLDAVIVGTFRKKRLMNASEHRVFMIVERTLTECARGHRLFAQTSLGEVLESADAHHTINAKRVDMLVVDQGGWPVLAIEYQGAGHYQGNAAARDAIKKEALRRADVRYVEITADDTDNRVRVRVREGLGIEDATTVTAHPAPLVAAG